MSGRSRDRALCSAVAGERSGVSRRSVVALIAYAALVGSVFTPLYTPFTTGRDDSWGIVVVLVAAHIGVGAGVARIWALLLPVVFSVAVFLAAGAEGLAFVTLLLGIPGGIVATGIGWIGAVVLRRGAAALAMTAFVCGLVVAIWAAVETTERATAQHVPAALQAQLPTELSLGNLCPGAETPRHLTARLRRQTDVLIRELHRHPDWLVSYVYYYSDDPEERTDITIRELAEEQLKDLESGGNCAPELQRRIRDALG